MIFGRGTAATPSATPARHAPHDASVAGYHHILSIRMISARVAILTPQV